MLKYTIHLGNVAVHTNNNIGRDEAIIALRDLFEFCDWIDYSYSREYDEKTNLTASSSARLDKMAQVAGEMDKLFSASTACFAKSAYSSFFKR